MIDREILTRVCDLLAEGEHRLTRGAYARTFQGLDIDPTFEGAICWCTLGAIRKVAGFNTDRQIPRGVYTALRAAGVSKEVDDWSDETPYPEIIATLARAAELAGGE